MCIHSRTFKCTRKVAHVTGILHPCLTASEATTAALGSIPDMPLRSQTHGDARA